MSDETQATVDPVAEALRAEQVRIEDAAIGVARDNGWCDEIERALSALFPNGPSWPNVQGYWTHSETGRNCRGYVGYDRAGFDRQGRTQDGYDRDGFDRQGHDRWGFDRDGNDRDGIHRDAPERFRFNVAGWDAEGFNREGTDRYGYQRGQTPAQYTTFAYDRDGFNAEGFNAEGFNRDGYNAEGYDRRGYDAEGFNRDGLDHYGYNRVGIDSSGCRRGADSYRRVADLETWRRVYIGGRDATANPEDYGVTLETPEQAAAAEAYWLTRNRRA